MQTFLPWPDYYDSMDALDRSRLGNQFWREGKTLINGGWPYHPASKMWQGFERELARYCLAGCAIALDKGWYNVKRVLFWHNYFTERVMSLPACDIPFWFGDDRVHFSHKCMLIEKDPVYYGYLLPFKCEKVDDYYWPV